MSNPKRHHFVPEMILNGFTDGDGWLHWCHPHKTPTVRRARPAELFFEKHLYSTESEVGAKDAAVELGLSTLETQAARVVKEIVRSARAGKPPQLSADEKRIWYIFFLTQWRRTPEGQQAAASDIEILQMLDDTLDELRIIAPNRQAEIDACAAPEAKRRIIKNVRVNSLKELSRNVMGVLERRGIGILRISKRGKSFIVGSRPVVKFTPGGRTNLEDPNVEMWLPIAWDVAAGVGLGDSDVSLHFLNDDKPIRQLNQAITAQSSTIAARSRALVRSLAQAR